MFAGPNGSGKTTILRRIKGQFKFGKYINADDIEAVLKSKGKIDLSEYGLYNLDQDGLNTSMAEHSLYTKAVSEGYDIDLRFEGNFAINPNKKSHSYEAALLAELIRQDLVSRGRRLTFETVMSHPSKIQFLKLAAENGYRNYLYFVCTENPLINVARVEQRVSLKGHAVDPQKIIDRYHNSLALLPQAIRNTYRTYIIDNSKDANRLILEVFQGREVTFRHPYIPHWVQKHVLGE